MTRKKQRKKALKEKRRIARQIIDLFKQQDQPLNHKQISKQLGLTEASARMEVIEVLEDLVHKGQLQSEGRGKYRGRPRKDLIEGIIQFTRKGSAFVMSEHQEQDVFIPARMVGQALTGDRVKVEVARKRSPKGPSGQVMEVLERARTEFVGTIEKHQQHWFFIPGDPNIHVDYYIPGHEVNGAKHGQKVVAKLLDWPPEAGNPFAKVTEVLGDPGKQDTEKHAILATYGFPRKFPEDVEEEAARIDLTISDAERAKRRDFRDITTFTIDPLDARDFDDALSFRKLDSGNLEIGIHIADVTHYVRPGSKIEKEAVQRATSVYLVDQVIPMLPEVLSNQVCSLRPNEEKLSYSAVFEMKPTGKVVNHWVGRTVIWSDHRFTYEQAQEVLETGKGPHAEALLTLNQIAKTLRNQRMESGAIAFDKVEVKFKLDEEKNPVETVFKVQQDAHRLIEEFMLLANRTVATMIGKKKHNQQRVKPFVYRIHDDPDPEKKAEFINFVRKLGHTFKATRESGGRHYAESLNQLLRDIKGKPEQNLVEKLAIRTMAKAVYSTDNVGHYGLAFDYYSHFTSPIRRYPDMMVHRLLTSYADDGKPANEKQLEKLCRHSSDMEKKATEAERESTKFYQILFLKDRIGEVFSGVVSGVSEWGIYVEIEENKCEGMIRLRDVELDVFYFDEKRYRVIGHNTGHVIQLGDKIRVKVLKADALQRHLDFALVLP